VPTRLYLAYTAFTKRLETLTGRQARHAQASFLAREHLRPDWALKYLTNRSCPPLGYVAGAKSVTAAEVSTPIHVTVVHAHRWCQPQGGVARANRFNWIPCDGHVPHGAVRTDMRPNRKDDPGVLANISLTARRPVNSSSSWYEISIASPLRCSRGATVSQLGFGDIRQGQTLRFQIFRSLRCKGTYRGAVGYQQHSGPSLQGSPQIGEPGDDGSLLVGRFTFSVR
jgi:hypothetical protein